MCGNENQLWYKKKSVLYMSRKYVQFTLKHKISSIHTKTLANTDSKRHTRCKKEMTWYYRRMNSSMELCSLIMTGAQNSEVSTALLRTFINIRVVDYIFYIAWVCVIWKWCLKNLNRSVKLYVLYEETKAQSLNNVTLKILFPTRNEFCFAVKYVRKLL